MKMCIKILIRSLVTSLFLGLIFIIKTQSKELVILCTSLGRFYSFLNGKGPQLDMGQTLLRLCCHHPIECLLTDGTLRVLTDLMNYYPV